MALIIRPHLIPLKMLSAALIKSFSSFPIYSVFVLINIVLDRVDHYVRHHPVQFACHLRFQISVHVLVVYWSVPLFPLAVPALLHVEEADV